MRANKAPAIGNKAIHRLSDSGMKVAAGIDAIVFSKTSNVLNLWCSRSHNIRGRLYT